MTIGKMFRKEVTTVAPEDTLGQVGDMMGERHLGSVVVLDHAKVAGIVTDRDLALALTARGLTRRDPVRSAMSSPAVTIRSDAGIFNATELMRKHAVRRLPVVDQKDNLIGLVSADDLLLLLGREINNLVEAMAPEVEAARPLTEEL
jgi:CBS domain-containing protein